MKRVLSFLAGAAAVLAATSACGEGPTSSDPWDLAISVAIDRDSTFPGDTVRVTVTATNTTDGIVLIELWHRENLGYSVRVAGDEDASLSCGRPDYGEALIRDPPRKLVFLPWESKSTTDIWTGVSFTGRGAGAGSYEVVGFVCVNDPKRPASAPVPLEVLAVLDMEIQIHPPVGVLGDSVVVGVALSNRSGHTVAVPQFSSCGFGVWVMRDGRSVEFLGYCSSPDPIVELESGETMGGQMTWTPTEAGEYEVFVQVVWGGQDGTYQWVAPLIVN